MKYDVEHGYYRPIFSFTTSADQKIDVRSFSAKPTYLGLLEGTPKVRNARFIISRIRAKNSEVVILPPSALPGHSICDNEEFFLPQYQLTLDFADIESGSSLWVTYFTNDLNGIDLGSITTKISPFIDWESQLLPSES